MHDPDEHDDGDAQPSDKPDADPDGGEATLLDELLEGPRIDSEPASAAKPAATAARTRVGRFVEWSSGQAPKVDFPGNEHGPIPARSIVALDPTTIAEAIQTARGVVLTFEDGRPDAPIITGLLHDFAAVTEAPQNCPQIWDKHDEQAEQAEQAEHSESNLQDVEARFDGKRIELEAADEIVLRCGQASIVLRRNGRIVIRGTYVETRSRGVNRIKGGSVQIN